MSGWHYGFKTSGIAGSTAAGAGPLFPRKPILYSPPEPPPIFHGFRRAPNIISNPYRAQLGAIGEFALGQAQKVEFHSGIYWDGTAIRTVPGGFGSYEIPTNHQIDVGYVTPCLVDVQFTGAGVLDSLNFFDYNPFFDVTDFFGTAANGQVDIFTEIALSQDGSTFGDWMRYQSGVYKARKFKSRIVLIALAPDVSAFVTEYTFSVYVPTRVDNYGIISSVRTSLTGLAVGAGGVTITFLPDTQTTAAAFNAGVSSATQPNISVTELNWQAGDIVVITGVSLSQVTIQVTNGGVGVARTINVRPEGY